MIDTISFLGDFSCSDLLIEHSENKINMYFKNKVGPGMLQSNVRQVCVYNLQKINAIRTE